MRTHRTTAPRRPRACRFPALVTLACLALLALAPPLARAASWLPLAGPFDPPPVGGHDAILDPVRHRMLVVAGYPASALWELPLDGGAEWRYVPCAGAPMPARSDASLVYDPVRDRLVIFGGTGASAGVAPSDVWTIGLAGTPAWSQLLPADAAVPARTGHTAIYDPAGDRMIVFGGMVPAGNTPMNDAWSLALSGAPAWTELAPSGATPESRTWHTAIHDAAGERMIVYGGIHWTTTETTVFGDVWALSLAGAPAWSELPAPASPAPLPRFEAAAAYDPLRGRMIVQGGRTSLTGSTASDAWVLDLGDSPAWTPALGSGSAPTSAEQGAIYDPGLDRLVYEGGLGAPAGRVPCGALSFAGALTWLPLDPPEPSPFPGRRYDAVSFFDAARGRLLVFGGVREGTGYSNEIWSYSTGAAPGWSLVTTNGTPPPFGGVPFAFDTARDRLVFLWGDARWYRGGTLSQAAALDLATLTWTPLAATGSFPPGRTDHSAVYDPVRDRIVVYGGRHYTSPSDNSGYSDGDAWSLSLATLAWSPILPAGTIPPTRGHHQAYFDAPRERMVVFGGNFYTQSLVIVPRRDAWALALGGAPEWTSLGPDAPDEGPALHDPESQRLVLLARADMGAWALPLAGGTWQPLDVPGARPGPRETPSAAWDPGGRRALLFGGLARGLGGSGYAYRGDLWSLALDAATPVAVPPPPAAAFALAGARPNPAPGPLAVEFTLPDAAPATLELLDLAGRRLLSREVGSLGAGRHVVPFIAAQPLRPALYFVRLTRDGRALVARACVVR